MIIMETFLYCYVGFFIIYDIVFIICCIYLAIIEECCCKNKIPIYFHECKNKTQECKNKIPIYFHECKNKTQECKNKTQICIKKCKMKISRRFTYIIGHFAKPYNNIHDDTIEEKIDTFVANIDI
jgi:hypothetical protein